MPSILAALKAIVLKLHFLAGIAMLFFLVMMVMEDDMATRALLLIPAVLLYALSRVLFAADQSVMVGEMMERYKDSLKK